MSGDDRSVLRPAPIWFVGACAAAAALIGSFFSVVLALSLNPSLVVGNMGFGPPRGLNVEFVALLFGLPLSGLMGAVAAYGAVLTDRPTAFGLLAIGAGTLVGALVGGETPAIADWWVNLVMSTGGWGWAEITALLTFTVVATVALSGRVALELVPTTRRGRLAFLLGLGVLVGVVAGMFIGGQVGFFSSFQTPCPPAYYGAGTGPLGPCIGSGPGPGLSGGMLLGIWLGAAVGAASGALLWAIPPLAAVRSRTSIPMEDDRAPVP
ncbi:MAG: hypothetical protein L3J92_02655 [Thermoplasmata archaeon]|nr:hypothetical protein [Thermoplasmata archaeon]